MRPGHRRRWKKRRGRTVYEGARTICNSSATLPKKDWIELDEEVMVKLRECFFKEKR